MLPSRITDEFLRSPDGEKAIRTLLRANFDKFRGPEYKLDQINEVYAQLRYGQSIQGRAMAVLSKPDEESFYVNFVLSPDMTEVRSITHNMIMAP
jgi:hypothetical protein